MVIKIFWHFWPCPFYTTREFNPSWPLVYTNDKLPPFSDVLEGETHTFDLNLHLQWYLHRTSVVSAGLEMIWILNMNEKHRLTLWSKTQFSENCSVSNSSACQVSERCLSAVEIHRKTYCPHKYILILVGQIAALIPKICDTLPHSQTLAQPNPVVCCRVWNWADSHPTALTPGSSRPWYNINTPFRAALYCLQC